MERNILILIMNGFIGLLAGCSTLLGPTNEKVRQEPNKTVYRSTDESAADAPTTVAPHQKIPGE